MRLSRLSSMFTMLFLVTALIGLTMMPVFAAMGNTTLEGLGNDGLGNAQYKLKDADGIKNIVVRDKDSKIIFSKSVGGLIESTFKVNVALGPKPWTIESNDNGNPKVHAEWDDPNPGTPFAAVAPKTEFEVKAVGGVVISIDKFGLLAPYIGLASTITVATVATAICVRRVKRRKEKQ